MGDVPRDIGPHAIEPRPINAGYRCRACGGAIVLDIARALYVDDEGVRHAEWVHVERASKEERDSRWHRTPESFGRTMRRIGRDVARSASAAIAAGRREGDAP